MIRSKNTSDACDTKNVSETSSCEIELNGQSSQILLVRNGPHLSLEKLRIRRDGTVTSNSFLVSFLAFLLFIFCKPNNQIKFVIERYLSFLFQQVLFWLKVRCNYIQILNFEQVLQMARFLGGEIPKVLGN